MLISTDTVFRVTLDHGEGTVGTVHDLFFDDQSWEVRYLVVKTGNWLSGRRVLLPPTVVEQRDWANHRLQVPLTQQQIKDSPDVDTDKPISMQKHREIMAYPYFPPMGGVPLPPPAAVSSPEPESEGDPHLRSAREVTGYDIEATDGPIGSIKELILDDEGYQHGWWEFRYLVVDTGNWLPGRKVLISPKWASSVDWSEQKVQVAMSREMVEGSPEFIPSEPINRRYEEVLYDYYGEPKYWIGHSTTTTPR